MKRFLMATAMVALSAASVANAQDRGDRHGYGIGRPGQNYQQQQPQAPQQQAAPQQREQRQWQGRGDGEGRQWQGRGDGQRRGDRGDRGDRGAPAVQPQAPAQPPQVQDRGERGYGGRDRGDRPQIQDRRDGGGRSDIRRDDRRDGRGGGWDGRRDGRGDHGWRGGDRNDYRQWRGNDHRGQIWPSQQRFRAGIYRAPYGFSYRRWTFGEYLPRAYYVDQYVLRDFWNYDLPEPPYGMVWIRYGNDALLIDGRSGYVEDVVYGIFW